MAKNVFDTLEERGYFSHATHMDDIYDLLSKPGVSFYIGFDPTADSLHVGHYIPVMAMAHPAIPKTVDLMKEGANLAHALTLQPEIGNIRETFFLNQLQVNHQVQSAAKSDFLIDGTYTFEIGGENKKQKQIAETSNAFLVKDDIEHGIFNIIPLWHFGLMY